MVRLFDDPMQEQAFFANRQAATTTPTKKRGRGGTATSLLSEGGAIAGGAAGAAAGSIVPGVGTILGGILGAGIGAFGGRLAENKVRDDEFRVGDAAKEGALSAALSAVPVVGKSVFSAGKGAVAKGVGKATGREVVEQAVATVPKSATRNAAERSAQSSLGNAWGIRNGLKINGREISTKRIGELQDFVIKDLKVPKTANADRVKEFAELAADSAGKSIDDLLRATSQPVNTRSLISRLEQGFNKTIGTKGASNPVAEDIMRQVRAAKTPRELWEVRKEVDKLINFAANDASAVPGAQQIGRLARKELNNVLDSIEGYKTLSRNYRNASDVVELTAAAARSPKGAKLPGFQSSIAGPQMQSARAVIGRTGRATGNAQRSLATALSTPAGTGAKMGATGAVLSAPFDQSPGENTEMTVPMTNTQINNSNIMNTEYAEADTMSSANTIYPRENLLADIQRDPANADEYIKYYQMLQEVLDPTTGAGSTKPLSAEASKVQSNALAGLEAINDFEALTSQDPSAFQRTLVPGRDLVGGYLGRVLGTTGIDASTQQIIDIIARLRTGAAISRDEEARFKQFIPRPGDPEEVRRQKLGYLRRQFERVAGGVGGGSGATDLESALLAL